MVWFWDRVCAIWEFICETPVHKGQRRVTMATNFGTKIVINAYKCISARANENAITYNRKFSWSDNPKKTFLIARSKRRCHGNHFFGQNRQKYHENGHNLSCMRHIHAEFGFDIWFLPSGNSPVTLLYTKTKGRYHGKQFWTIIAINAFLRETMRAWLLIIESFRGRPFWRKLFW